MALNKKDKRKAQDNPFLESQKIASQFDDATLKQDVDKLRKLILSIEKDLGDKDIFLRRKCIMNNERKVVGEILRPFTIIQNA